MKVRLLFAVAVASIFLAAWRPLYLAALRNSSNLHFIAFAASADGNRLERLAASEADVARLVGLGVEGLAPMLAMLRDRLGRYAEGTPATSRPLDATPVATDCRPLYRLVTADAEFPQAELGPDVQVALRWTLEAPLDEEHSTTDGTSSFPVCPASFTESRLVHNLAWSVEDLNTFTETGAYGYASGTRTAELRDVTANRVETVNRHGRSATVFAMENLTEVNNVLQSEAVLVEGGQQYLLAAWMRTDGDSPNSRLALVCRGSSGEPNPIHYTVAREFHSLEWQHAAGTVHLAEHLEYCRVLLLNYGPAQTAWFDEILFACLPQDGDSCSLSRVVNR